MKTTVDISDSLLRRVKARAVQENSSMRDIINAALRQFLAPQRPSQARFRLKDGSFRGNGLAPGIREGDWEQIRDIIYEGRGGSHPGNAE